MQPYTHTQYLYENSRELCLVIVGKFRLTSPKEVKAFCVFVANRHNTGYLMKKADENGLQKRTRRIKLHCKACIVRAPF